VLEARIMLNGQDSAWIESALFHAIRRPCGRPAVGLSRCTLPLLGARYPTESNRTLLQRGVPELDEPSSTRYLERETPNRTCMLFQTVHVIDR